MTESPPSGARTEEAEQGPRDRVPLHAYPSELECDVVTESGEHLRMRPIRPDDAGKLVDFHDLLSPGAIYQRYFSFHPELSTKEVAHLTQVDYYDRLAFVLQDGDLLVAVGRYDRIPGTDQAEAAFLVTDEYQRDGIGLLLLDHLADAALQRGINTFVAETQAENRGMMGVFQDSGFPVSSTLDDDVFYVSFPLQPTEASIARRAAREARARVRADRA
jgi:GNAT superfamily N-acetyltransferase